MDSCTNWLNKQTNNTLISENYLLDFSMLDDPNPKGFFNCIWTSHFSFFLFTIFGQREVWTITDRLGRGFVSFHIFQLLCEWMTDGINKQFKHFLDLIRLPSLSPWPRRSFWFKKYEEPHGAKYIFYPQIIFRKCLIKVFHLNPILSPILNYTAC